MIWRKKFFRFLKEEGVYQLYIDNLYEQHPIWDNEFWEIGLKNIFNEKEKCCGGISYAFCLDSTKQGYNFWLKLSIKWNDKCGY